MNIHLRKLGSDVEMSVISQYNEEIFGESCRPRAPSFETELFIETELLRYRVFQAGTGFFALAAFLTGYW